MLHSCWCQMVWLECIRNCLEISFLCTTVFEVCTEWSEKQKTSLLRWEKNPCQKRMVKLVQSNKRDMVTQITTFCKSQRAEMHLRMDNKPNLEADGLKQQKTPLSFTPVSQEKKSDCTCCCEQAMLTTVPPCCLFRKSFITFSISVVFLEVCFSYCFF